MARDHRDLAIEDQADDNADLRAKLAEARAERDTLAELLRASLDQLHTHTATVTRQTAVIRGLRSELHRYTAGPFTVSSSEESA